MQPTTKKDQFPNKDAQQHADKAKDAVHSATDHAKDAASHAGQAASSLAGQAKDAASNFAGQAANTASHLAGQAKDAVSGAASTAGKKAEEWVGEAGKSVGQFADSLRHAGPDHGVLGKASSAVAEGMESAGHYMQDKNLSGMMDDVTDLIKRNPIPALLVGLGVGFLLGKAMRS